MLVAWATANGTAAAYYHGGSLVHAGVACVVADRVPAPGAASGPCSASALMAWIGRLSYGLYLFHWPIIVWLVPNRVPLDGLALDAARVGLTVIAAVLSYYLVELPVRERRPPTAVDLGPRPDAQPAGRLGPTAPPVAPAPRSCRGWWRRPWW